MSATTRDGNAYVSRVLDGALPTDTGQYDDVTMSRSALAAHLLEAWYSGLRYGQELARRARRRL